MSIGNWCYLTLMTLAILSLFIAYRNHRTSFIFLFFFAGSGITLFFDYIIYVWGNAYLYQPDFIKGRYDSYLGAIINSYILPSFAILYIVLRGKWIWCIVAAAFFSGVELLFEHLGVFHKNWWRIWYTFIILIPYFYVMKIWWNYLTNKRRMWVLFGTTLAIFYSLYIQLTIILYAVLKLRTYHVDWIEHFNRDSSSMNSLIAITFGSLLAYISTFKVPRVWHFLLLFGYLAYDLLLKYLDVVRTDHIVLDTVLSFMTFLLPMIFLKYSVRRLEKNFI